MNVLISTITVETLLNAGVKMEELAIITPYNGQVELLRGLLLPTHPKLEIRSVDGFQGSEREAVVLSLVRSSSNGGIGFLADERRLNVAITRARRHCAVICDTETVSRNSPFLKRLMQWLEEHGETRSAAEFNFGNNDHSTGCGETVEAANLNVDAVLKQIQVAEDERSNKHRNVSDPNVSTGSVTKKREILVSSSEDKETDNSAPLQIQNMDNEKEIVGDDSAPPRARSVANSSQQLATEEYSPAMDGATSRKVVDRLVDSQQNDDEAAKEVTNEQTNETFESSTAALQRQTKSKNVDHSNDDSNNLPQMNNELAQLALERIQRQHEKQQHQQQTSSNSASSTNKQRKNKKKIKSKNPTTTSKPKPKKKTDPEATNNKDDAIEDDMAFLDSEIEKVQNSHGRKVEGTGKQYRTIINGMLIARPASSSSSSSSSKRDSLAAAALRSKLQKAEADRKVKPSKK